MKTIFTLVLTFCFSFGFSQNYYKAVQTELYRKNEYTKEWELADQNKNVSITIVSEENSLSIQAKSPTMYKLYPGSSEKLDLTSFDGYRYNGLELKSDKSCTIDILRHKSTGYVIISIVYDVYNLRYIVEPIKN